MVQVRVLVIAAAFLAVAASSAYVSKELTNYGWQTKWDQHLKDDADATSKAEAKQRLIESNHATEMAKVAENGQSVIDQLRADADTSQRTSDGLHDEIKARNARLAASEASLNACTSSASKAATEAAILYAELFQLADQAAGDMASTADQAIERGQTCEKAYQTISSKGSK